MTPEEIGMIDMKRRRENVYNTVHACRVVVVTVTAATADIYG
jgi:hypothetical protein